MQNFKWGDIGCTLPSWALRETGVSRKTTVKDIQANDSQDQRLNMLSEVLRSLGMLWIPSTPGPWRALLSLEVRLLRSHELLRLQLAVA